MAVTILPVGLLFCESAQYRRCSRSRRLAIAPLFVILAASACAGPTAQLKRHAEQCSAGEIERGPQSATPTQDVRLATAEPSEREAVHACARASAHWSLATPEAAVNLYVESIAANDFACALRAFAAHEHAARQDFTALVRWVGVFAAGVQNAPAEYPMFVEINELRAKAEMAQATKFFVYRLLTDTDPRETQTRVTDDQIAAFIQAVNPARLATLKVVRIDQPNQSVTSSPKGQALFKEMATREGADEMTERIALYELSGQLSWSGFRLCRYDKTWKILDFAATFGAPPGAAGRTTAGEYEALLH